MNPRLKIKKTNFQEMTGDVSSDRDAVSLQEMPHFLERCGVSSRDATSPE
jgi:hypothetical protein